MHALLDVYTWKEGFTHILGPSVFGRVTVVWPGHDQV